MNIQEATQHAIDLNLYMIRRKDWKRDGDIVVCISIKGAYSSMDMVCRRTLHTVTYLPSVFDILANDWEVVK